MGAVTSKTRIYDLAKELKIDTKRLIEEVRREGVDVSVPSNSISKELAEKIRTKYFPKKETAVKRTIKVVKRAARPVVEEAPAPEVEEAVLPAAAEAALPEPETTPTPPPKPAGPTRLVKKLTPAVRAEQASPGAPSEAVRQAEPTAAAPAAGPEATRTAGTARQ